MVKEKAVVTPLAGHFILNSTRSPTSEKEKEEMLEKIFTYIKMVSPNNTKNQK